MSSKKKNTVNLIVKMGTITDYFCMPKPPSATTSPESELESSTESDADNDGYPKQKISIRLMHPNIRKYYVCEVHRDNTSCEEDSEAEASKNDDALVVSNESDDATSKRITRRKQLSLLTSPSAKSRLILDDSDEQSKAESKVEKFNSKQFSRIHSPQKALSESSGKDKEAENRVIDHLLITKKRETPEKAIKKRSRSPSQKTAARFDGGTDKSKSENVLEDSTNVIVLENCNANSTDIYSAGGSKPIESTSIQDKEKNTLKKRKRSVLVKTFVEDEALTVVKKKFKTTADSPKKSNITKALEKEDLVENAPEESKTPPNLAKSSRKSTQRSSQKTKNLEKSSGIKKYFKKIGMSENSSLETSTAKDCVIISENVVTQVEKLKTTAEDGVSSAKKIGTRAEKLKNEKKSLCCSRKNT